MIRLSLRPRGRRLDGELEGGVEAPAEGIHEARALLPRRPAAQRPSSPKARLAWTDLEEWRRWRGGRGEAGLEVGRSTEVLRLADNGAGSRARLGRRMEMRGMALVFRVG